MPRQNIGHALKSRREELGISLEMAAAATNVRARMLEDIETGDYANFPPYGYSMGIISSYARYLRIDPRPLLERFEYDYASYESGAHISASAEKTRRGVGRFGEAVNPSDKPLSRDNNSKSAGFFRRNETGNTGNINAKLDQEQVAEHDDRYKSGSVRVVGTRQTGSFSRLGSRSSRMTRDDMPQLPHEGSAPENNPEKHYIDSKSSGSRSSSAASGYSGRLPRHGEILLESSRRTRSQSFGRTRAASTTPSESFTKSSTREDSRGNVRVSDNSNTRLNNRRRRRQPLDDQNKQPDKLKDRIAATVKEVFSETRTRAIALIAVILVVLVIVTAAVLISTAGDDNANVIDVEGGAKDTTTTSTNSDSASATITTVNGNTVKVEIDVAEGQTSLITVTFDDDNAYSGAAVGPWHQEFIVTESFSATFGNPDAVTVTENGNKVEIDKNSDGTGSLLLNIETTSTTDNSGDNKQAE